MPNGNALAREVSPYLLQHADNPVDWLPWGEVAFARARDKDRPILLSIGYAACHWCHVMAHESFANPAIAGLMNQHFVNIKVDREERPDVDRIYMQALQALGEPGGWPLTMFLTPDLRPFWGGTYFPPKARFGRPGFADILTRIADIWRHQRHKAEANAQALTNALVAATSVQTQDPVTPSDENLLASAANTLLPLIDLTNGGLRGAPKFPHTSILSLLWSHALETGGQEFARAVDVSLTHMVQGGIYDHLAGGFARYSVDDRWLVPHFEKMLYDNALIVDVLASVGALTGNRLYLQRVDETASWMIEEMRSPSGAFAASYDADSDGEEGLYYLWDPDQVAAVLGDAASEFCRIYDITADGNFEGRSIPNRLACLDLMDEPMERRLAAARKRLRRHRDTRNRPGFDDKVLADWNGLAIRSLASAGCRLNRPQWITAAKAAFQATLDCLTDSRGQLYHAWRNGERRNVAGAEDHVNLAAASLKLFQIDNDPTFLDFACTRTEVLLCDFWDDVNGGLYHTPADADHLIVRARSAHDEATPNPNATMLENLTRLLILTGNSAYGEAAEKLIAAFAPMVTRAPAAYASLIAAITVYNRQSQAVLITDDPEAANPLVEACLSHLPDEFTLVRIDGADRLAVTHPARHLASTQTAPCVLLCRAQTCFPPITTEAGLHDLLATIYPGYSALHGRDC